MCPKDRLTDLASVLPKFRQAHPKFRLWPLNFVGRIVPQENTEIFWANWSPRKCAGETHPDVIRDQRSAKKQSKIKKLKDKIVRFWEDPRSRDNYANSGQQGITVAATNAVAPPPSLMMRETMRSPRFSSNSFSSSTLVKSS